MMRPGDHRTTYGRCLNAPGLWSPFSLTREHRVRHHLVTVYRPPWVCVGTYAQGGQFREVALLNNKYVWLVLGCVIGMGLGYAWLAPKKTIPGVTAPPLANPTALALQGQAPMAFAQATGW